MIYLLLFFILLYFVFYFDIKGKKGEYRWYWIILFILIMTAGLRWRIGIDTPNYIRKFYYYYPILLDFSIADYPPGKDPLYVLINSIVKTIGGKFYIVQFIQAIFVNTLVFVYIKKHSQYIYTCVFFYYILCYTTFSMEVMRGAMSITLCLFANDFILEKKWVKGYLLYFVSFLFHAQTVVMFFIPFLFFMRLDAKGIVILIVSFIAGSFIAANFGDYIELIELGESISERVEIIADVDKYSGQEGNLNFFLLRIIPKLICAVFAMAYVRKYTPNDQINKFEPLVLLGIMFTLMQMNVQIFYRFVDYFTIYFIIYYASCFVDIVKRKRHSKQPVSVVCLVMFSFLLLSTIYNYSLKKERYLPYSSVINREIVKQRETYYYEHGRPGADLKEY